MASELGRFHHRLEREKAQVCGLTFDPDALREVAKRAIKRGTGARGLRAILEAIMTDIMFELPTRDDVREVVLTKESVTEGRAPLLVTERVRAKKEA